MKYMFFLLPFPTRITLRSIINIEVGCRASSLFICVSKGLLYLTIVLHYISVKVGMAPFKSLDSQMASCIWGLVALLHCYCSPKVPVDSFFPFLE